MDKGEPAAITHVHIQRFELAHHKIYTISKLLGHMNGLALWIKSCRMLMAQGKNRITRRSLAEAPILIVPKKSDH